ncbi:serine hydrolase [Portibacter lacus]|uniref:T9SS type A sorting domain-containing protein n=1 Tax=Portibacter lacus TaxID=1099794 RepID=A0AA37SYR2_9BACT|nr:serine hydrolase [Portibacter lacus]GLR19970.1 hypothetical protein GCM10007940_45860 [Portibacter lacus]
MKGIDTAVQKFLDKWFVPGGISVAISKDGRLVYERGFGKINNTSERRVYPEHKFRVASVSKPITAVAILQLIENGELSFDDVVFGESGILNEYTPTKDARIEDITIYDLLHHLGGWGDSPMFRSLQVAAIMNVPSPPSKEVFIEYMMGRSLDKVPGTSYKYSNFGYLVLGRVIEKISGKSYEEFIKEEIFDKINASSFVLATNEPARQDLEEAYYFSFNDAKSVYGDGSTVPLPYGGFDIEAMDAHGGWVSTAGDLIKFGTAVDGKSSRPDIISPFYRQLMVTPSNYSNYAKGWAVGNGSMWHVGSLPGTTAEIVSVGNDDIVFSFALNFRFESNIDKFNEEIDAAIWEGIYSVNEWPEYDLFTENPTPIELEEGDVIARMELDSASQWGAVIWNGDKAWVLNETDNNWYEVDKITGLTGEQFPNRSSSTSTPKGAAWSKERKTILMNQNLSNSGEVWEVDLSGNLINTWSTDLGEQQRGLAIFDDEIWIALPGNNIYRFGLNGEQKEEVNVDVPLSSPTSLAWVDGRLWVNDSIDNLIRIFDYSEENRTLEQINEIPAPYAGLSDIAYTGDHVIATSINSTDLYELETGRTSSTFNVNPNVKSVYNYPNPFTDQTTIDYFIAQPSDVNLSIYNMQGQEVANLVNGYKDAGKHTVRWRCTSDNGSRVEPGIYIYKLRSGKDMVLKKMILIH